jgi:hypothetical protein
MQEQKKKEENEITGDTIKVKWLQGRIIPVDGFIKTV